MFAGSCIGVICLVISLEFLRRVQREYDAFIQRQDRKTYASAPTGSQSSAPSSEHEVEAGKNVSIGAYTVSAPTLHRRHINRVTLIQRQLFRALLHMVQFGVAYFIMLLAMYYNGE
jgi:copper transporter 1